MKYCPNCEAEYDDSVLRCVDCDLMLVDEIPLHCPVCEERIDGSVVFCPHCGRCIGEIEAGTPFPKCERHALNGAVGICVVCSTFVCDECLVEKENKIFCSDDSHVDVHRDYALVYQTSTDYEAAMIQSNLVGAGIDAKIYSQLDRAVFFNIGGLATVNIMAPKSQVHEAQEIIQSILANTGSDMPPTSEETIS